MTSHQNLVKPDVIIPSFSLKEVLHPSLNIDKDEKGRSDRADQIFEGSRQK